MTTLGRKAYGARQPAFFTDHVWHITHRCHKKEFLLKFARDRKRWLYWLFEARKRYGLRVLNYIVTSNHIHLLILDSGDDVIPRSIQLIAGRIGQEYNQRKRRKGAFWEDRYHATAIETDHHLARCLVYIDLNMVRAGVVKYPSEWPHSGYQEIQDPPKRYGIIDLAGLMALCGISDLKRFQHEYQLWVETVLEGNVRARDGVWTEGIAVGSLKYVEGIKEKLGIKAKGRDAIPKDESYMLKEPDVAYGYHFDPEMGILSLENAYIWDEYVDSSIG